MTPQASVALMASCAKQNSERGKRSVAYCWCQKSAVSPSSRISLSGQSCKGSGMEVARPSSNLQDAFDRASFHSTCKM